LLNEDEAVNVNPPYDLSYSIVHLLLLLSYAYRTSLVITKTQHSRFCDRTGFFRKYKLLDFGSFLVDCGHMLGL
jgi:hypothetical protein